ncbi:hypothetical protein DFH06DRAFT_573840 [Mycena polygramma]|nr:hypothetical protein DFH06DRAFT_573840 [Mycena polygramma]
MMKRETDPESKYLHCLPVFYANLHPVGIPTENDQPATLPSACALIALNGLRMLPNPIPAAGADLWPRICPWITFFYTYRKALPDETLEIDILKGFLFFYGYLRENTRALALVLKTPGVRTLATRAWKVILQRPIPEVTNDQAPLVQLAYFLTESMQLRKPENMLEVLDGAGGSWDELAEMIALYIKVSAPRRNTSLSESGTHCMGAILFLLEEIDDSGGPITATLIAHGLVSSLTAVVYGLSEASAANTVGILGKTFDVLRQKLKFHPWQRTIPDALAAHILSASICCGIREIECETAVRPAMAEIVDGMIELLRVTLPSSMVYYPVVSEMKIALQTVVDHRLVQHPNFAKSPIYEAWLDFRAFVDKRISVAKQWESAECVSRLACDNLGCGDIRPKREFKSCGQCHRAFYCSAECQKIDWQEGAHRERCASIRSFSLRHPEILSTRNLSFLRALVRSDYEAHKVEILHRQVACVRAHPVDQIVTRLNYTAGHVRISVEAIPTKLSAADIYRGVDGDEYFARAMQSAGHMELLLVLVQEGTEITSRMFTLRSKTPVLYNGVRRLAAEISLTSDGVEELQELIRSGQDGFLQICV